MLLLLISAIVFVATFTYLYKWKQLVNSLPPGPPPLPLVGNVFQIDSDFRQTMLKWHRKYGPMYTVWLGTQPQVFVTGYQLMHDLFIKRGDEFADRPDDWLQEFVNSGKYGIITSSGDQMKEQRRFTLQTLRNFGFGRKIMEEKVSQETEKFVKTIKQKLASQKSRVMNISSDLQLCIGNIISSIIVGRTFEPNDSKFVRLTHHMDSNFKILERGTVLLLNSFPWLRFIPLFNHFGVDDIKYNIDCLRAIVSDEVEEHKKEIKDVTEPNDFTTAYLQEIENRKKTGQNMGYFSERQLLSVLVDLWVAGMETTATTMGWAILLMMKFPHIQAKVQKELDSVLGFEKPPTLAEKANLPYVTAVLHEVQRYANIGASNFGRKILKDAEINGYVLPANTTIVPQMPVLHCDDEIFPHPQDFNPNRFLEADGKTLKKCDELLPFSIGKRSCPAESLARLELFIIFSSLMQKFVFQVDPNQPEPTLEPVQGFTISTQPYDCLITERF